MSEEVKIMERKDVPHGAVMLFGFPDVGSVSVIAVPHLISEFNLTEVAYVDSRLLPPLIVLYEGLPHSSIRIFARALIWTFDCRENTNMKFQ